ncbi:lipopolysaccharide export system protein LptA [Rhizobiales bacterium GAS191]|nr:lipopolysaccharide export system protein LptA [Rhizobiales bacterium GAS191]
MRSRSFVKAAVQGALAVFLGVGLCTGAYAEAAKNTAGSGTAGSSTAGSGTPAAKAPAAKPDAKSDTKQSGAASPFPTKSKDPIYITADRLDIFDKEGRAVYSGASGVTVTQGASKVVGSELTAYYERQKDSTADKAAAGSDTQPAPQSSGMAGSAVKRILVKGPVSVVQNDQVATGDAAEFDRVQNIVTLIGHVSLTQGPNVTTGDKMTYDLNSGVANVFSAPGTPVKSLFVQGSQSGDAKAVAPQKASSGKPAAKPAVGKAAKTE